jgi:hypothetical protein
MLQYYLFTTRENRIVKNRVILSESYEDAKKDLDKSMGLDDGNWWIISCFRCDREPMQVLYP